MEIVGYERSRAVRLVHAFRPQGAPVVTEAFAKLIARYGFAKFPSLDDIQKGDGPSLFHVGKFQDVQIDEFGVYADGYSASGRCSTKILDDFLDDVAAWAVAEIGLKFILPDRNEVYYESNIVVQTKVDLAALARQNIENGISEVLTAGTGFKYIPSGIVFDCDPAELNASDKRRKPWRLFIERKTGFPFRENLFLCQAPIGTPDHLRLLQGLEQALSETGH